MNTNDPRPSLPPAIAVKLRVIRRRARLLALLEGLARTGAVLIGVMLLAMLIDLAMGWFDPRVRYIITSLALGIAAAVCILWCGLPLARRRTIVATAREVDQTIPQLEERWSTVTELAQSNDAREVRGSEQMIRKVASEAESASADVQPEAIISAKPLFAANRWLLGAMAMLAVMLLINFSQARVLLHRFWIPGDEVSLTEISASPADSWVAKGESLALRATLNGRLPKHPPIVFVRRESGNTKEVTMSATPHEPNGFRYAIDEVSESFEYRVRAGDGQTRWHRITAVERPEISAVRLTVIPPAYTHLPREEKNALPQTIRVLQGSEVEVAFKSDQPLDRMLLDLGNGQSAELTATDDNWYQYRSRPAESFRFATIATNKFKLENKNKPSCRVTVYQDLPPSVKVITPHDELTVLPEEKVNVTFEAADDFGVARAEVIVTTNKADGETNTLTFPVKLEADEGSKKIRKSFELDPRALGLKHGDELTYVVRVTDTKQNPAEAAGEGRPPSTLLASENQSKEQAEEGAKGEQSASPAQTPEKNDQSSSQEASSLVAAAQKRSEEQAPTGSRPPPNEMSKRMLDAGQCASCKASRIVVDEWAGTFEGEKRKKLEIAIAPVLEELAKLLRQADENTDLLKPAAAAEGLQATHAEPLNGAKARLGESESAIAGLKSRTSGTAYAFAGLQLHNIGGAHVTPAHRSLDQVSITATPAQKNVEPVGTASFHIGRAREMLADLTRTFEKVKREQQVADAMQKLAKMHQLFIEDTQALLGSSKGPINSYDRKIAEVDEQFVEKLKALLEEKKKIMAELSKLLSEDPRLLRRFLAMQQLQCTTYRDQMTLLAERQKVVQQQIASWNASPEAERGALLSRFREGYNAGQLKIVQDATTLRENMETWLPLDVKPENPQVETALHQAEKIVQLTAETTRADKATSDVPERALAELRSLRENISHLNQIGSKDGARMTAYIANRLADVESLITAQSGQMLVTRSLSNGDFAKVAEVSQEGITQETLTLEQKLEATEKQVASLSDEIAEKAELLNKTVRADIVPPQQTSVNQLTQHDLKSAGEVLTGVVPAFALAEQTFDDLMRLIIAKLDEAPAPSAPGQAPGLDSLLAMLQDEVKACESLGIPCRPLNVSLMTDWLKPGSGIGQGMGQAQAQAAQAQSQQAKSDAERLEKEARENARKGATAALKDSEEPPKGEVADRAGTRTPGWNKLASRLQKDLLQGRENTPPEQYRAAIDSYFKAISEVTTEK